MAKIRVDQSHCNYHLSQFLQSQDWHVLFTDPGRTSRGGSGSQGNLLRVFESNGFPIPDIVALDPDFERYLIVEIGGRLESDIKSFDRFDENEVRIRLEAAERLNGYTRIAESQPVLAFCKTGRRKPSGLKMEERRLAKQSVVDWMIFFPKPRSPVIRDAQTLSEI